MQPGPVAAGRRECGRIEGRPANGQPAPARADISLDPELYLATRDCYVELQGKPIGNRRIEIHDHDPEGNFLVVEHSGDGWRGEIDFDGQQSSFLCLISGQFTFDIDEVITIESTFSIYTEILGSDFSLLEPPANGASVVEFPRLFKCEATAALPPQ